MLKRLTTIVLLAGSLALSPGVASAAPAEPSQSWDLSRHRDDDHRRCMYRCDERDGRDRYRDRDRRDYESSRHRRYCWYRDRWGWYQAPCGRRHRW